MKNTNIITKAPQVLLKKNNTGIRHTLCYAACFLGIVALLIGCPDDNGNGDGTERAYTCENGTAADGTTTNSNTERCSTCTDPYDINSDTRICQAAFTCTNGQAEPGFATGSAAIESCTECSFSYHLDENTRTCNLILESTFNITDMDSLELGNAIAVTTAVVGTTTYLFVAGWIDDGVSVFSVADDGTLASVYNISDGGDLELDGARGVTTAVVGTTTYLFVTGQNDSGVSVFSVASDGMLASVHNEPDAGPLALSGASGVTTAVVGTTTYLFVTGQNDSGVSVFSVADGSDTFTDDSTGNTLAAGTLTPVHNVSDSDDLQLNGANGVTTAVVDGTTYLFVTGQNDHGVSVFSVASDGMLASVYNISDDGDLELNGANGVTTAVVDGTTYLFVTGQNDHGVSVFSVASDGMLASVYNISDDGDLELNGANGVTTAVVDGTTYLFVTGQNDHGVSVFSVASDGMLASVHNEPDNGSLELYGARGVTTTVVGTTIMRRTFVTWGPWGVATAVVGTTTYLFVAGFENHGVSVFRVQ